MENHRKIFRISRIQGLLPARPERAGFDAYISTISIPHLEILEDLCILLDTKRAYDEVMSELKRRTHKSYNNKGVIKTNDLEKEIIRQVLDERTYFITKDHLLFNN